MNKKWLTPEDVADELGIGKMTVYRMIQAGTIPAHQFGRLYRVRPEDLKAYICGSPGAGEGREGCCGGRLSLTRQQKLEAQQAFADGKACGDCGGLHQRACNRVKRQVWHRATSDLTDRGRVLERLEQPGVDLARRRLRP